MNELERILEEEKVVEDELLDFYFHVRDFLNIYEVLDENYVIYTEMESDGRFKVKLFCINPATNLEYYLSQGNSTIYFSATLLPIQYYKTLLSVEKDDYAVYAESPFDCKKRLLMIGNDVSSRYTMRGNETYAKYAEYIEKIVTARKGNYLVFFPSYRFMEDVWNIYRENVYENAECILQDVSMTEEKREIFLGEFEKGWN